VRADSLGHLAPRNRKPIISKERPQADVIHLTSARPAIRRYDWVSNEHEEFKRQALSNENVVHIQRASDIPKEGTQLGLLFGLQNAPSGLTSAHHVRTLVERGIRFMSLAHNGDRNEYGSGFLNARGGLTADGRSVIRWMGECGMVLDISHLNDETAIQALTLIKNEKIPMVPMASHSGIREAFGHARNLPRETLELLRALNGYAGLKLAFVSYLREAAAAGLPARIHVPRVTRARVGRRQKYRHRF
jgi:microsomal dipeptidase-like Zn-dependent dipeptidase